jgi:hypothetical protein
MNHGSAGDSSDSGDDALRRLLQSHNNSPSPSTPQHNPVQLGDRHQSQHPPQSPSVHLNNPSPQHGIYTRQVLDPYLNASSPVRHEAAERHPYLPPPIAEMQYLAALSPRSPARPPQNDSHGSVMRGRDQTYQVLANALLQPLLMPTQPAPFTSYPQPSPAPNIHPSQEQYQVQEQYDMAGQQMQLEMLLANLRHNPSATPLMRAEQLTVDTTKLFSPPYPDAPPSSSTAIPRIERHPNYAATSEQLQQSLPFLQDYQLAIPQNFPLATTTTPTSQLLSRAAEHTFPQNSPAARSTPAADQSPGSSSSSRETFPMKLHRLLHKVAEDGNEDVVSWMPSGMGFKVHDQKRFVEEVVPHWFRHKQMSSFRRQLSMYGFERVPRGPNEGSYRHRLFHRDRPDWAEAMTRVSEQPGVRTKGAWQPDFHDFSL